MSQATPARRTALAAVVVVAALLLAHGRTLGAEWSWAFDDFRFIVKNPHVTSPASWSAFFTDMRTTDPLSPVGLVRPLRTLEFALDAKVFGLSPAAFRVHGLLWFAAGGVALLLLLRDLLGDLRAATLGAALWVVHPMQTEAAQWISSRGDVACGALTLAAVWTAVRSRGRDRWLAASLVVTALALLYKEAAVVVPLLVVIARAVRPEEGEPPGIGRTLLRAWPWCAVAAAYLVYRATVQVGGTAHVETYVLGGSPTGTLATMCRAFGAYVGFALVPARPAIDWFLPATTDMTYGAWAWVMLHAGWLLAALQRLKLRLPLGAAVLWFYAALLPVANWPFYLGIPTAERFLHVALAGMALAVAWLVRSVPRLALPTVVLVAACAGISWARAADWRDDTTLWPSTARVVDSPRAEGYLAAELRKSGFAALTAARRLPPGAARDEAEAEARVTLEAALEHAQNTLLLWRRIEGRERSTTHVLVEPLINASNLSYLVGRPYDALRYAEEAISIGESLFPHAHYDRALALLDLGRGEAAAAALERALDLGFATGTDDERTECVALLRRAAALCEDAGATEIARRALVRAAGLRVPASEDARRALAALESRVAAQIDALRTLAASDARARGALAIVLAGDGRLQVADDAEREASLPGAARVLWIQARWCARGTPDGWRRALDACTSPGASWGPDAAAEAVFLAARCLEELGDPSGAREQYARFLADRPAGATDADPRVLRARRHVAAHDGPPPAGLAGTPDAPPRR